MAYTPYPRFDRSRWLLCNEEIIEEPPIEATPSAKKVRLAGQPKTEVFAKDTETIIQQGLEQVARKKRTAVWMPLDIPANASSRTQMEAALGFRPQDRPTAELDLLNRNQKTKSVTWWHFKHPSLPIEAYVVATLYTYSNMSTRFKTTLRATFPFTLPHAGRNTKMVVERSPRFAGVERKVSTESDADGDAERFRDFVLNDPPEWASHLGTTEDLTERVAVETYLRNIRAMEELDSITIPDLRKPAKPGWLELELEGTSFNAELYSDLVDYIEDVQPVEKVLSIYHDLIEALRGCRLVVPASLGATHFAQALSKGDDMLTMKLSGALVGPPGSDGEWQTDARHVVSVHLPTGTFVVSCAHDESGKQDKIAQKWDEALLLAEVYGKKDVLLAYAEEYVASQHEGKAKNLIKQRKKKLQNQN